MYDDEVRNLKLEEKYENKCRKIEKNNISKTNLNPNNNNQEKIIKEEQVNNKKEIQDTYIGNSKGGEMINSQSPISFSNQENPNSLNMEKDKLFQTFILFQNFMKNMNTGQNAEQLQRSFFNEMSMQMNHSVNPTSSLNSNILNEIEIDKKKSNQLNTNTNSLHLNNTNIQNTTQTEQMTNQISTQNNNISSSSKTFITPPILEIDLKVDEKSSLNEINMKESSAKEIKPIKSNFNNISSKKYKANIEIEENYEIVLKNNHDKINNIDNEGNTSASNFLSNRDIKQDPFQLEKSKSLGRDSFGTIKTNDIKRSLSKSKLGSSRYKNENDKGNSPGKEPSPKKVKPSCNFDEIPIKPTSVNFLDLLEKNLANMESNNNDHLYEDQTNNEKRVHINKTRFKKVVNVSVPTETKKYKYYSDNFEENSKKEPKDNLNVNVNVKESKDNVEENLKREGLKNLRVRKNKFQTPLDKEKEKKLLSPNRREVGNNKSLVTPTNKNNINNKHLLYENSTINQNNNKVSNNSQIRTKKPNSLKYYK